MIKLSEPDEIETPPEKKMGRPSKYSDPKEKFRVYNLKKPSVRLSQDEKKLIDYVRKNPDIMSKWLAEIELGF